MYTHPLIAMHFLNIFKRVVDAFSRMWGQEMKETLSAPVVKQILGVQVQDTESLPDITSFQSLNCKLLLLMNEFQCDVVLVSPDVFGFTNVLRGRPWVQVHAAL